MSPNMSAYEKHHEYQLVKFLHSDSEPSTNEYDCVPLDWITFDAPMDICLVKYPPPPYNNKSIAILHDLVKKRAAPVQHWPSWPVEISGGAGTYFQYI